jgi:hypothetical protein
MISKLDGTAKGGIATGKYSASLDIGPRAG